MTEGPYRWIDPATVPVEAPETPAPSGDMPKPRRFGARTLFIPIGAMAGHFLIAMVVTLVFSAVVMFLLLTEYGMYGSTDIASVMDRLGQEAIDKVMLLSTQISAVYSVLHLALFLPILRYMGRKDRAYFPNEKARPSELLSAVAIAAGLVGLVTLLFLGLEELSKAVPFLARQVDAYNELSQYFTGTSLAWTLVATCLLVPIAEEVIFRGIIQNELRRAMPVWAAVVLQAVVFALFHMNFIQSTYVLFPALLLGATYAWTRSFAVPVALHIAFNFLGAGLPAILGESSASDVVSVVEFAFILVGALCALWLYSSRKTERTVA